MTIQQTIDSIVHNLQIILSKATNEEDRKQILFAIRMFRLFFPDETTISASFKVDPESNLLWAFAAFMGGVDHFQYTYGYMLDKVIEFEKVVNAVHENLRLVVDHFNRNIIPLTYLVQDDYTVTYGDYYSFNYDKDNDEWSCAIKYGNMRLLNSAKPKATTLQIRKRDTDSSCSFDIQEGNNDMCEDLRFLIENKLL